MIKKIQKCDVTRFIPLPLSQTVTPSQTASLPLERDALYGRPLLCPLHDLWKSNLSFSWPPFGNPLWFVSALVRGVNLGGWGGRDPQIFGTGVVDGSQGNRGESWTGREILLYLMMYRKYVLKWW